jgi:NADP-dependent 3-hydroxy acid dehydrogenase YdfG
LLYTRSVPQINSNNTMQANTAWSIHYALESGAISEGLRQEAGDKVRVTIISPGFVRTDFTASMTSREMKARIRDSMDKMGISPDAIARAIVFAIEQPADVDVGEMIVRPTAQS